MLHVPGAEAEIIKADLASVVVQFMQGPSLGSESTHVTVLNALYLFSGRPVGRQQLLEKLTPDSLRIMIDLSLNCLEAPDPNHSGLSIAAGHFLLCTYSTLIASSTIQTPVKVQATRMHQICCH